jgi:hypothetical protein
MIKTNMNSRFEKTALVVATVCGVTASLLMSGPASAESTPTPTPFSGSAPAQQSGFFPPLPADPDGITPLPGITVSLPVDTMNVSLPASTVYIKPVTTTLIDSTTTGGANLVGFQGDFTFDSSIVGFGTPPVQRAGLTSNANWNISIGILPTPPTGIRTARLSAFMSAFVPLEGSGTLFELRMRRVSNTPGASTALTWAPQSSGNQFIFIDDNLLSYMPNQPSGLITISPTCYLTEGFEAITTLVPGDWFMQNNSQPGPGVTGWFQGSTAAFPSQSGAANSYIAANYDNGTGTSTLSNWLLTPIVTLQNGAQLTFWTRTVDTPVHPDRLQVRMSTNGSSSNVGSTATDVGDFTTLLLDINPTYTTSDYPSVWTQFTVIMSGLGSQTPGRLAFRYFVENGGPTGANSDYIGIDAVQYACTAPTPTPTPTPTPITISGTISYCSNPVPGPVPNVTLALTGTISGSTLSGSSGNYTFSSLPSGGTYTVTPSKVALAPGSAGIDTVDVAATQHQFFRPSLSGCRLTAADVNGDGVINTVDVIAIQRFYLGLSTGIANVGKYQFIPTNRTYPGVVSDQTAQNYDTLIFGDVASHFAE